MKHMGDSDNLPNGPAIKRKIKFFKKDWRTLNTDAKCSRIEDLKKLGCSVREIAKGIGVDEGTLRNCVKKRRQGGNSLAETKPQTSAPPKSSGCVEDAPLKTRAEDDPLVSPLFTKAEIKLAQEPMKPVLDPARVIAAFAVKAKKPEPTINVQLETPTQESRLDVITRQAREQMGEYRRFAGMGAEVMRELPPGKS